MKTFFRLSALAILLVAVSSCTKSDLLSPNDNTVIPPSTAPSIEAKIFHLVNQPFDAELGTSSAVFHQGDNVTIYIPYLVSNDDLQSATITLNDDATGDAIGEFALVSYNDPSASQLNLPESMKNIPFMFVTFNLDNSYTDKTISLTTVFTGQFTGVSDAIPSAFSVVQ